MTKKMLENDQRTIKEALQDSKFELEESLVGVTNATTRAQINAEIDRHRDEIRRIRRKEIDDGVDALLANPTFQADLAIIRKGAQEAKKLAQEVARATNKLQAAAKLISKLATPLEKLVGFLT